VHVPLDGRLSGELTTDNLLTPQAASLAKLDLNGARYTKPREGQNAVTLARCPVNSLASFDRESWPEAVEHPLLLTASSTLGNPETVQLDVSKASGFVRGTFYNPESGSTLPFRGVVLQGLRSAEGYFSADDGVGSFILRVAE
jgi:hypothetical protein